MKKNYIPPVLHYVCSYLLGIALLTKNTIFTLIFLIIWFISLFICYIETIFVIIPHYLKNKRISSAEKRQNIISGLLFNAIFIVSYSSQYIYKEKKDTLITNLSTLIGFIGYIFIFFAMKNTL